jgi:hypothetical protein
VGTLDQSGFDYVASLVCTKGELAEFELELEASG